jgi:predicted transcriptional regulator
MLVNEIIALQKELENQDCFKLQDSIRIEIVDRTSKSYISGKSITIEIPWDSPHESKVIEWLKKEGFKVVAHYNTDDLETLITISW